MTALTVEEFEGIETPHGKIVETASGVWVAYGHLSEDAFRESYNWVPADLRDGELIHPDCSLSLIHRWAVLQRGPSGDDDDWEVRWGAENTQDTPGAFPVTVML